jgi:hypothetical protein
MIPNLSEPPAPPACDGADPSKFDVTDPELAEPILTRYCRRCPVVAWCEQRVRPASSKFTGIAADNLYVDGKVRTSSLGRAA